MTNPSKLTVRRATAVDAQWIQDSFAQHDPRPKPAGYFAHLCDAQAQDRFRLFVASAGDDYVGHCKVDFRPEYAHFSKNRIPEIQDLYVIAPFRCQGVGSALLDVAETTIAELSKVAGIGVGLYADYGSAQRLYTRRGYIPDGRGIAYEGTTLCPGQRVLVDDDLVLYLIKDLSLI